MTKTARVKLVEQEVSHMQQTLAELLKRLDTFAGAQFSGHRPVPIAPEEPQPSLHTRFQVMVDVYDTAWLPSRRTMCRMIWWTQHQVIISNKSLLQHAAIALCLPVQSWDVR